MRLTIFANAFFAQGSFRTIRKSIPYTSFRASAGDLLPLFGLRGSIYFPQHIEHCDRHRNHNRSNEDSHDSKCPHTTQQSKENQKIVHLCASAHHVRPHQSIHLRDNCRSPTEKNECFTPMSAHLEHERPRDPYHPG